MKKEKRKKENVTTLAYNIMLVMLASICQREITTEYASSNGRLNIDKEAVFKIAEEKCINWVNRILFSPLLCQLTGQLSL